MGDSYCLAMYDVRGKQEFIFRTNKLQEIVGASWIIRDVYKDYLFPAALAVSGSKGIFSYMNDEDKTEFSKESFEKHLEDGYIGEVIYEGGGNFQVLFKDIQVYKDVTYEFTKRVLEHIGTLKVLGTAVEVDKKLNDYLIDQNTLRNQHRIDEANETIIAPWACIPIVQVDRKTSQALIDWELEMEKIEGISDIKEELREILKSKGVKGKLTKESFAKLLKYHVECMRINDSKRISCLTETERDYYRINEKILDEMVEEKGEDSNLAVIYIDGNSMGAKVQAATGNHSDYKSSIKSLRDLSENIQKIYVDDGIKAALKSIDSKHRIVVYAGDEINFIVKAKEAFSCAVNYLNYLKAFDRESSCAGISVFHSHSPYSDAYRIAEEACESGKQKMKALGLSCAAFVDYHIGQGAVGISLDKIREHDNYGVISRPWLMWCKDDRKEASDCTWYENDKGNTTNKIDISTVVSLFNKIGRSNIKGLADAAKKGDIYLEMELRRIKAHQSDEEREKCMAEWERLEKADNKRNIIYDIVIAYDLWFCKD